MKQLYGSFVLIVIATVLIAATPLQYVFADAYSIRFAFSEGNSIKYYTDGQVTTIEETAYAPAWSNDGSTLAYISGNLLMLRDFDTSSVFASYNLGAISAQYLSWSPNDAYVAIASETTIYTLDVTGTSSPELTAVPNLQLGPTSLITSIGWHLTTNMLFYASPGLGIATIAPDGSDYALKYDAVAAGMSSEIISSLHYSPTEAKFSYVNQNEQAADFSDVYGQISDPSIDYMNSKGSPITAIVHGFNVSDSYYLYGLGNGSTTSIFRSTGAGIALYTSPEGVSISSISSRPYNNREMLYTPSVYYAWDYNEPDSALNDSELYYNVNLAANSSAIPGKTITITPILIETGAEPLVYVMPEYSTTTSFQSFDWFIPPLNSIQLHVAALPSTGTFHISCLIEIDNEPLLTQTCPQTDGTVSYYPSLTPVYRFWSAKQSHHFYTADEAEALNVIDTWPDIWEYETTSFSVLQWNNGCDEGQAVYRFWSDKFGGHFYTISDTERTQINSKWSSTWADEGARYCASSIQTDTFDTPLYRFWSNRFNGHFYTTSVAERDNVISTWPDTWTYEGVAYYVAP